MEHLEQAKTLYRKRHDNGSALSADDRESIQTSIQKLIRCCLEQQGGVNSFRYLPFIHIIKDTVASGRFQGDKAASAFSTLENYLLLLVAQPWKREFWLLKTYGGYFSTKVKAHLEHPEEVLQLVGFAREEGSSDDSRLVLDQMPDSQVVLNVAFDCQVAHVECQCITEFHEKMKIVGFSLASATQVQLSGQHNDPMGSSGVVPHGKGGMPVANTTSNHYTIKSSDLSKRNGARSGMGQSTGGPAMPRMVGMGPAGIGVGVGVGVGVGTGSNVHQVTGVPPRPAVWNPQIPQDRFPGQPLGGGIYGNVPQMVPHSSQTSTLHCLNATVPNPTQPTVYMHPTYSEVTGSGVHRTPSWASSSSGYSSAAPSQISAHSNYNPQHVESPRDHVDSPNIMAPPPPPQAQPPSNLRSQPPDGQLRQPWQPAPDVPFIDDDDPSPCLEATHAQHLQESARAVHSALPSKNRTQVLAPQATGPQSRGMVGREGSWSGYDCGQWVAKEQKMSSGTMTHNGNSERIPSLVQRPATHHSADATRWSGSQPATAVTALLNKGPTLYSSDPRRPPSMDPIQHRAVQSSDFPSLSASRPGAVTIGPQSEPLRAGSVPHNNGSIASKMLYENTEPQKGGKRSQVFYPPNSENAPGQGYMGSNPGPSYQPRSASTLAQMEPGSRDKWGLVARQPQGSQAPSANNMDKPPPGRNSSSGSVTEVMRRSKVKDTVSSGGGRCNSLISPQGLGRPPPELSRQTSRSLDMSALKWKCQTCTMENGVSDLICTACSRSRDAPEEQYPVTGVSKLPCPSCTFENPPGLVKCEICSGLLPQDIHTYV